jgi:hypothetical protein
MLTKLNKSRSVGLSAMPVMLIMAAIISEVMLAGLVTNSLSSRNMADQQAGAIALEVAKSGANDAIIRINRYMKCPDTTYCPAVYPITIDSGEACVNLEETVTDKEITIYSRGIFNRMERFIKAVVTIAPAELSINTKVFKEIEDPGDGFCDCRYCEVLECC